MINGTIAFTCGIIISGTFIVILKLCKIISILEDIKNRDK